MFNLVLEKTSLDHRDILTGLVQILVRGISLLIKVKCFRAILFHFDLQSSAKGKVKRAFPAGGCVKMGKRRNAVISRW